MVCSINEAELDTILNLPAGTFAVNKQPGTAVSINRVGDIIAISAPKQFSFFDGIWQIPGKIYKQDGWVFIYKITKK